MINKKQILFLSLCFACCHVWGQKNPCNPTGAPYTSLPGDTTLILKGGTHVTFNRCEFFDLRDCLEFEELFDQQSIETSGLVTQDDQGNILLSCGMFRVNLKEGCTDKKCFEVPVKVRMPFSINFAAEIKKIDSCRLCSRSSIRLFTSDGGDWSDSSNLPYKIIDTAGHTYFEFYITCPNKAYNCDCRHPFVGKVKIKAPRGNRLEEVIVRSSGCPIVILRNTVAKPRRRLIVKIPCPTSSNNITVSAKGTGRKGEIVTFGPTPLKYLKHGSGKRNCSDKKGKIIRRILGIFPVREGFYYRKYLIR